MTAPGRYAVIPTRDRPADLAVVVTALHRQDVDTIVVDNNPSFSPHTLPPAMCLVIVDGEQPPNLSRLWNLGIEAAAKEAASAGHTEWDVAVVNDDAVIPDGWFDACSAAMRRTGAAAACSDPHGRLTAPLLKTEPDGDPYTRMCGWAFLLRGEAGLRADEQLRWWYGDTDLDWAARAAGGMVIVPGHPVGNLYANSTTVGVLAEQAGRDRGAFAAKHGSAPW